jgi:cell division septum initiation protein DivIVA
LELSDNYRDLENFYGHQKPTWDKLRKACDRFQLNRLELERDPEAASALRRMQEILQAASPYGIIKEAEGLIGKVEAVNTSLVSQCRTEALAKIDKLIAEVTKDLDTAEADEALRSTCLRPLNSLRGQVEKQESVAHITQAEQVAIKTSDVAMTAIDEAVKKKQAQPEPTDGGPPLAEKHPRVKARCVIKPAELMSSSYLVTMDDVNQFVDQLRQRLEQAIASGERIQIR